MMKILVISSIVGRSPHEIFYNFVFDEIVRLVKRGCEVHVARYKREGDVRAYGVYFHDLQTLQLLKLLLRSNKLVHYPLYSLLRNPQAFYMEITYSGHIIDLMKKLSPNILHAHFAYPEGWVARLAVRSLKRKIPFVVTLHGYDILTEPHSGYGIRLNKRYDLLVRKVLEEADAVIVASKAVYEETEKITSGSDKLHLIHNGVDLQKFNPSIDGTEVKRLYNAENKNVVFTLRHHEPKYGIAYLILAAKIVLKHKRDTVFIIGGDGSLRNYHMKLAKQLGIGDHVFFPGRIFQEEVPKYYAASDVVAVPSLQEAWGLVATEAMACGKPVVATKVGGLPDQVIEGFNGFLVQPRDPKALADRIIYLLENPPEARRMGLNGRRLAEDKFDIERRIDKILELYRMLIEDV
jgi:glycosyltransferase involved in cell wall biosynthesis